ncbi:MAG: hypothetical protein JWM05_3217 [Acidimicrobiales bacterium]|nr:hypothetical protein [Acidimicrobiales bacterium]
MSGARGWTRGAAALAMVIVVAFLAVPTAAARPSAPLTPGQVAPGPKIELMAQASWVDPDGTFLARLRVTGAPARSEVVVAIHERVTSRAAFDQSIPEVQRRTTRDTFPVIPLDAQPLEPTGGRSVPIVIPLRGPSSPRRPGSYRLDDPGVYPLRIWVRDRAGAELTHVVTHLIRLPSPAAAGDPSTRLRVAPLLALHAPPALQPDGTHRSPAAALRRIRTWVDTVSAHPKVSATVEPTPETLDALAAPKSGDVALLRRLRAMLAGDRRQVLSSTYVRVDATAWVSGGLIAPFRHLRDRATSTIGNLLGRPDNGTWVGDGDVTPRTVSRLRETGVDQLVVPEENLAQLDPARFPDDVTQPFKVNSEEGVPTPTVQVDARLRGAFTRGTDPRLAAHQLLAELAVTSYAQRGTPGAVVLSPPESWRPSAAFLGELFGALEADNPLMVTATLDQVFASVPPAGANGAAALQLPDRGGDLVRALTPADPPSLGRYAQGLAATQERLSAYGSMVAPRTAPVDPFRARVDVSGSADLRAAEQQHYLDVIDTELDHRFAAITAPPKEKVTLAASNATFPLSLRSSLPYPVKVLIELEASNRLTFPDGNQRIVTLQGPRTRVTLHVRAVSGDTPLRITVRSADGAVVLPNATTRYTVRSTAVSGVGLVLTVGAAAFLLLWWARHWRSSRRPARHVKR